MALKERRASRRFLMRLPLTVRWTDELVVGEALTESREVSSRGLYFHLPKGLRSGCSGRDRYDSCRTSSRRRALSACAAWDASCAAAPNIRAMWAWRQRSNVTSLCARANSASKSRPAPRTISQFRFLTQTLRRWVGNGRAAWVPQPKPPAILVSIARQDCLPETG